MYIVLLGSCSKITLEKDKSNSATPLLMTATHKIDFDDADERSDPFNNDQLSSLINKDNNNIQLGQDQQGNHGIAAAILRALSVKATQRSNNIKINEVDGSKYENEKDKKKMVTFSDHNEVSSFDAEQEEDAASKSGFDQLLQVIKLVDFSNNYHT